MTNSSVAGPVIGEPSGFFATGTVTDNSLPAGVGDGLPAGAPMGATRPESAAAEGRRFHGLDHDLRHARMRGRRAAQKRDADEGKREGTDRAVMLTPYPWMQAHASLPDFLRFAKENTSIGCGCEGVAGAVPGSGPFRSEAQSRTRCPAFRSASCGLRAVLGSRRQMPGASTGGKPMADELSIKVNGRASPVSASTDTPLLH